MMQTGGSQTRALRLPKGILMLAALPLLSACEDFQGFNIGASESDTFVEETSSTTFVERDVEAPEIFYVSEAGLWDGRPSLGGVWAAHPDVIDPERVIIRNKANGKFVIGALFRRERAIPGPRVQLSSDAASALSVLAGQPVEVEITALRREEAPAEVETVETPDSVQTDTLDPIASAAAAIDTAEASAPTEPRSTLAKPFVQIGIFSIENNANNAANQMRAAGMIPTIKRQTIRDKAYWRVVVGPATARGELNELLRKIKASGFTDAYAVTN